MILAARSCRAFIAGRQNPEAVSWPPESVSRETAPFKNKEILFPDTEIAKNHLQDVFDINPAQQPPQGMNCYPQLLGGEFLTLADRDHAALQRSPRLLQQFSLTLAANHP